MVLCWSQQPRDRPSASQIVSIASAPEFTHLYDIVSLNHSAPVTATVAAALAHSGQSVYHMLSKAAYTLVRRSCATCVSYAKPTGRCSSLQLMRRLHFSPFKTGVVCGSHLAESFVVKCFHNIFLLDNVDLSLFNVDLVQVVEAFPVLCNYELKQLLQ